MYRCSYANLASLGRGAFHAVKQSSEAGFSKRLFPLAHAMQCTEGTSS
eukprot:gene31177-6321_t